MDNGQTIDPKNEQYTIKCGSCKIYIEKKDNEICILKIMM